MWRPSTGKRGRACTEVESRQADVPQAADTAGMLLQASGWLLVVTSMMSLRPSAGFLSTLAVPPRQVALPSRCSARVSCRKTLVMQQASPATKQERLQGYSHKFSIYIEDTVSAITEHIWAILLTSWSAGLLWCCIQLQLPQVLRQSTTDSSWSSSPQEPA